MRHLIRAVLALTAGALALAFGAGACTASFSLPCLDATVGGTGVVSALIHVR